MTIALYNPLSCNGDGKAKAERLKELLTEEIDFRDIRDMNFGEFFASLEDDDKVIICGGDGTISKFINSYEGEFPYERDLYYFSAGLGNDFAADIGESGIVLLNPYIKDLPVACINGKQYKVLNGVGFGIDGYCCEEGDRLRAKNVKKVNYTSIAIKGLLFHFKPRNATVIVDGKEYHFKKTWICPTMNGRYYGGGMLVAPKQDRLNKERKITNVVMFGKGALRTLILFPSIFKGKHVEQETMVKVLEGYEVEVKFDRPTALQLDGETFTNVEGYTMKSAVRTKKEFVQNL